MKTNQLRSLCQVARDPNSTICQTDAAWKAESKAAGLGWVRIDQSSESASPIKSALIAEGLAILIAMEDAKSKGLKRLIIESDSQQNIKAIAQQESFSHLHGILSDIETLSLSFDTISFFFISRQLNNDADCTAKRALEHFGLGRATT